MNNEKNDEEIKTDLKHDNLEYTELSDGEEPVANEEYEFEEDEVQADELDALEDDEDNEAAALVATESDLLADEDQLPEEDWTDDLPDTDAEEDDSNHQR